jgi:aspartate/methionine/tyrosine aminotransferase
LLLNGLRRLGIDRLAPADGAFYVYADISDLTDDSTAFCARLLDQFGVAAAPGVDFDPVAGRRFIRFSFAGSTASVIGALGALEGFLARS